MQKMEFTEALDAIVANDPRYDRDAYIFLRDALDAALKQRKKKRTEILRHVSGSELLEGVKHLALREFGPMTTTVFDYWGIKECGDFGEMVFNLIRIGVFGKNESDSIEDFKNGYDFHETFVEPFLPKKVANHDLASKKTSVKKRERSQK